jgi:hypothetical protein
MRNDREYEIVLLRMGERSRVVCRLKCFISMSKSTASLLGFLVSLQCLDIRDFFLEKLNGGYTVTRIASAWL